MMMMDDGKGTRYASAGKHKGKLDKQRVKGKADTEYVIKVMIMR
jgi:hypothetical protein